MALTAKQQRFVDEYLVDLNATQAAIRAGYDWPASAAGFYVYMLIDPCDGEIFYVGKGTGRRIGRHVANVRKGRIDNGAKCERIARICANGETPLEAVFADGLSEPDALAVERELIRSLRARLTNIAGGVISSEEAARKHAAAMLATLKPFRVWVATCGHTKLELVRRAVGKDPREFYDWYRSELEKLAA